MRALSLLIYHHPVYAFVVAVAGWNIVMVLLLALTAGRREREDNKRAAENVARRRLLEFPIDTGSRHGRN